MALSDSHSQGDRKAAKGAATLRLFLKNRMHVVYGLDRQRKNCQIRGNKAMLARAHSWRWLAILLCCYWVQLGAVGHASAQTSADGRGSFLLGTSPTGGSYHPVGVALSTLVKLKLLPEFGIDLTAVNTTGSRENVDLIRQGDVQFAIISALAGHDARTGAGEFARVGGDDDLRAVTTLWLSADHLLIRKDNIKSGTISDFLDLSGRPVSLGRQDTNTILENRALMSALGVDIDNAFDRLELTDSESAEALAAGQIDGMSISGGIPFDAVRDAYQLLGNDAALLEVNDEEFSLIDGGRGLWQRVLIPSGTYPGQDRDILTIGVPNILAVHEDVDEDVVYQITRTIFEELGYLQGLHSTTRQISLDQAVDGLPLPIHAGAQRYFEEKGVELPLPPIRLDPNLLTRYPTVEEAREDANRGVVTMFAGTDGDTTTQIAAELVSVLDGDNQNVRLLVTNGGGMGQNLTDLLYLRGVDTALVRADLLNYAQSQNVYPPFNNAINYISEMFPEEVHLLVRSDIADLNDLTGRKINIGVPGTGTDVTASIILSRLGLRAELTRFEARPALEKLKQGEIDGAFFVGGEPMPILRQIDRDSGLKFIAVPPVEYFDSYRPAEIDGSIYPNLMRSDETVPTIAVRTALLTYSWRPDSERYQALGSFADILFDSLLTLQEGDFHPKWREIDPTATFASWPRFQPAALWISDNEETARRIIGEGRSLLEQQSSNLTDATALEPLPIETEVDGIFLPEDEIETIFEKARESLTERVPAADASADAEVAPRPSSIELSPEPVPATGEQKTNSATLNGAGAADLIVPRPVEAAVPATGANAPTF